MADAKSAENRLPWLATSQLAKAMPRPAAHRARTPLLLVVGLFLTGAVAAMAYFAGRSLRPVAATAPEASGRVTSPVAPAPAPTQAAGPRPTASSAPPAPVIMAPATAVAAPVRTAQAERRATWTAPKRVAEARSLIRHRIAARSARLRYRWPANFAGAPSGRVVQLGAYYTGRQTRAAWLRLRRAYPYLTALPRKVVVTPPRAGRPRYYRLRFGTRTALEARTLCSTLHRIGRGCIVV
mgnify:CR=1 FL=1